MRKGACEGVNDGVGGNSRRRAVGDGLLALLLPARRVHERVQLLGQLFLLRLSLDPLNPTESAFGSSSARKTVEAWFLIA